MRGLDVALRCTLLRARNRLEGVAADLYRPVDFRKSTRVC